MLLALAAQQHRCPQRCCTAAQTNCASIAAATAAARLQRANCSPAAVNDHASPLLLLLPTDKQVQLPPSYHCCCSCRQATAAAAAAARLLLQAAAAAAAYDLLRMRMGW